MKTKCKMTASGNHFFNKVVEISCGSVEKMVDVNPIMGQKTMKLKEVPVYKSYKKCSACGFVDDENELRKPRISALLGSIYRHRN